MASVSMADLAVKVVTFYGTRAEWPEINQVISELGFQDPDGEIAVRVKDLVREAIVRVRVPLSG